MQVLTVLKLLFYAATDIVIITYTNKFKWKAFMKNAVDLSTTRQLMSINLRPGTFNTLLQLLAERCHHSAPT